MKEHRKEECVRGEAHSGNAQGGETDQRDSVPPRTLRLIRQAMDKEHQVVWSPENTGINVGTPSRA